MGDKTIEFVYVKDGPFGGTYIAPAGMNYTLTNFAGNFRLTERHGPTMIFDAATGRIASITDLYNKTQHFTYSGSKLSEVADAYGRKFTFNWNGEKISSVSDETGRVVGFGYTDGNLTSCTDVEGKTSTYSYDTDRRLTVLHDPSDRIIARNIYDAKGRVIQQKSMGDADRRWNYYYTGHCTTEENPLGGKTLYAFDSRGRSLGVRDALGLNDEIVYDGQDRRVSYTTPKNEKTSYTYDKNNNLTKLVDPKLDFIIYHYDSSLRPWKLTDKRGKDTTYTYNTRHQVLTVTDPLLHTVTNTYDGNGNLQTVKDAAILTNNTTTFGYDDKGQLNLITYADTKTRSFFNNPRGDVRYETDSKNQTTEYNYNNRRQLTKVTPPGSVYSENTYNNEGQLETSTDERGNTTTYTYNAAGKLMMTTYPTLPAGNNVVTNEYDFRDWLYSSTNSLNETSYFYYDAAGRLTSSTDPLNRTTINTYDANDRIETTKDPLLRTTQMAYTSRGEPDTVTDPALKPVIYAYDGNGNRTDLTDRRGKPYVFAYDDANRLTSTKTPLQRTTGQGWTPNNLPETITEPSTQAATLTYDNRLRVQTKSDQVGTVSYGYDNNGNLLWVTQGQSAIGRTYDSRNRVYSCTDTLGNIIGYRYDDHNNLTKIIYPGDKEVNYTYNSRNLLETVTDWSNRVTTYQYDRVGRLVGMTRHNGTAVTYKRDAAGQIREIKETVAGKLLLYHGYGYDLAGQIDAAVIRPKPHPFTMPARTATYDDDNRLETWNGQNVTVDADGNMTSGPLLSATPVSYSYNSRNQLLSVGGVSYTYDAEGTRVSRTQDGQTTHFAVDTNAPLSRVLIRQTLTEATHYVYGIGLLYEVSALETTKVYHYNFIGSTVARTNDSGAIIGRTEYSPYGTITHEAGDTDTPFLFSGRFGVITDSNGLLYMRARYYNPYLQRFLNPDPMGFAGGSNFYAFANGDPISLTDPFGLCAGGDKPSGLWSSIKSFGMGVLEDILDEIVNGDRVIEARAREHEQFVASQPADSQWAYRVGIVPAEYLLYPGEHKPEILLSILSVGFGRFGAGGAPKTLPELRISPSRYPELADNILNAQKAGHPSVLTHGGNSAANRAAALDGVPNIRPLSRDEYPFASSLEGGGGSWVGHIPVSQQNAQGALLKNFFKQNNIKLGDQYRVIVGD